MYEALALRRGASALVCWLAAVSLTWRGALADEVIREHGRYEPADTSPLDGRENLFRGTKVLVSDHWSDRVGELAVDGRHDAAGDESALLLLTNAEGDVDAFFYQINKTVIQLQVDAQ